MYVRVKGSHLDEVVAAGAPLLHGSCRAVPPHIGKAAPGRECVGAESPCAQIRILIALIVEPARMPSGFPVTRVV